MGFENIHRRSIRYEILKAYGQFLHNYIFYRKVHVHGLENIPKNTPLIITANHQNALMDALAIGYAADHQPVFLARSDIFSNPFIASILRFFKIMPVYRIRDGKESLGKNDEIFDYSTNVLKNKKHLAVMPEGNHGNRRQLRMLKKGVARIAFKAEEQFDFKLGLKVLPVGLDYSNYVNFRTSLFINIGEPFTIDEFKDVYYQNPKKAFNLFNEKLKNKLSEVMIDIQNDNYYDTYYNMRELYNTSMRKRLGFKRASLQNRFFAGKEIISKLDNLAKQNPELLDWFKEKIDELYTGLEKFKIKTWVIEKKKSSYIWLILESLVYIVFLPVHIFGLITNYLPYKIPVWLTDGIKDKQFVSSVKYVLLMIIFLIFYIIEIFIFSLFTDSLWIRNVFFISLPLAGYFTIENWILFKKFKAKWNYKIACTKRDKEMLHLLDIRNEIISKMDEV